MFFLGTSPEKVMSMFHFCYASIKQGDVLREFLLQLFLHVWLLIKTSKLLFPAAFSKLEVRGSQLFLRLFANS
jgi:hypothetical protein